MGHNNPRINNAMLKQIQKGVNFSIPSTLEYELGCILLNRFPMYKAVKFFKNGGDSVYAAVRSSRFFLKKIKFYLVNITVGMIGAAPPIIIVRHHN